MVKDVDKKSYQDQSCQQNTQSVLYYVKKHYLKGMLMKNWVFILFPITLDCNQYTYIDIKGHS